MANIPISSLPLVVSLDGSEAVPLVQGGTTKRALVSQINAANIANIPAGGLTGQGLVKSSNVDYATQWKTVAGFGTVQQVDTGSGLTGGPITLTGTIALAPIATGALLANVSGVSAAPSAQTPSAILDVIGSTRGSILYRGLSGWSVLGPSTAGRILTTGGAGADPSWSTVGAGSVQSVGLSLPAIFTVSGSPVTTSGTLSATLSTQTANQVWAGPASGAAVAPAFRSLVGADLPAPSASTLGGIQSFAGSTSQWIRSISTSGIPSASQPAFSDISGVAAPSQIPNPSATTLGGIQSLAPVASRWVNGISTSGVPSTTQPAFSDVSGNAALSQLPLIGNNTILANTSGGSSVPMATSPSALLDTIGATQGDILYRDGSVWSPLAPGVNGQVLASGGPSANPSWVTVSGTGTVTSVSAGTGIDTGGSPITTTGTVSLAAIANQRILANVSGSSGAPTAATMTSLLDIIGATQGQVLYRGSSSWTALAPGTSGQFLQTLGTGSTPQWAAAITSITPGSGLTSTQTATAPGSAITTSGTLSAAELVNAQTGTSYAIQDSDRGKLVTASNAAAQAYSMAQAGAASQFQAGWFCDVRNVSTNAAGIVTITPSTSTIDGSATYVLAPGRACRIVSDGTNFQIASTGGKQSGPSVTRLLSGTAATYTTPAFCTWLRIRMVGGGAGGSGAGTAGAGSSSAATASTWSGGSLAAGGAAAGLQSATGNAGGTASGGNVANINGAAGSGGNNAASTPSPAGGSSYFGGAGAGVLTQTNGGTAAANSGSGGGGGGMTQGITAGGSSSGGAGAYVEHIINSPSATYTYTVGTGSAGGAAGTSGAAGGAGADGQIIVEAYFN